MREGRSVCEERVLRNTLQGEEMSILECTAVTSLSSEGCEFRQVYSSVGCITQLYLVKEKSAVISPALQKSVIQKAVMQNRMKRIDEVEHLLLDTLKDKRKKHAARDRSSIDKDKTMYGID